MSTVLTLHAGLLQSSMPKDLRMRAYAQEEAPAVLLGRPSTYYHYTPEKRESASTAMARLILSFSCKG